MSEPSARELKCRQIAKAVGMNWIGDVRMEHEVMDLARQVGMHLDVMRRPLAVAAEITAYLDDIARNP